MSRRVRCYLARAAWVALIVGALVGLNFLNLELERPLLWADKHTTVLSFLSAVIAAVLGAVAVLFLVGAALVWLWDEAFGPKCR